MGASALAGTRARSGHRGGASRRACDPGIVGRCGMRRESHTHLRAGNVDPVDKVGGRGQSRDNLWHVERSCLFL